MRIAVRSAPKRGGGPLRTSRERTPLKEEDSRLISSSPVFRRGRIFRSNDPLGRPPGRRGKRAHGGVLCDNRRGRLARAYVRLVGRPSYLPALTNPGLVPVRKTLRALRTHLSASHRPIREHGENQARPGLSLSLRDKDSLGCSDRFTRFSSHLRRVPATYRTRRPPDTPPVGNLQRDYPGGTFLLERLTVPARLPLLSPGASVSPVGSTTATLSHCCYRCSDGVGTRRKKPCLAPRPSRERRRRMRRRGAGPTSATPPRSISTATASAPHNTTMSPTGSAESGVCAFPRVVTVLHGEDYRHSRQGCGAAEDRGLGLTPERYRLESCPL
ncbi:hypothetical protein KM043_015289 [Ampulex compressa]|nr:hypothetical protein KM043_015289 [Ampulex compressa]